MRQSLVYADIKLPTYGVFEVRTMNFAFTLEYIPYLSNKNIIIWKIELVP